MRLLLWLLIILNIIGCVIISSLPTSDGALSSVFDVARDRGSVRTRRLVVAVVGALCFALLIVAMVLN